MNVLYVSRSKSGSPHPFVREQAEAIAREYGHEISHYLVEKGGLFGYMRAAFAISKKIKALEISLMHAHYGLAAVAAVFGKWLTLRRKVKIVITFHGSDINKKSERPLSLFAARQASHNILVSHQMQPYFRSKFSIIPCGIDAQVSLQFRDVFRQENGWGKKHFVILFSSSFDRAVKDPAFAYQVIDKFSRQSDKKVVFLELKGYNREQVTQLMQAADVLILCSHMEGSPQIIKEAILNALPVITNDVGDIPYICEGVDNCYIIPKELNLYVSHLNLLAQSPSRIKNRGPVLEKFDNKKIAELINNIYMATVAPV